MSTQFFSHRKIAARAARRPPGYTEDLMRCAVAEDANGVTFDTSRPEWAEMHRKYSGLQTIARGAKGIAKAMLGIDKAAPEVVAARKATCLGCEHVRIAGGIIDQCALCGCAIRFKILIAREKCPADKWPA